MSTALRRAAGVAIVVLATTSTSAWAAGPAPTLRLSRTTAVPGQVLTLQAAGIGGRQASVTIGGRTARIVRRTATSVRVVVPRLRAGTVTVRARRPGGFITARLRIDAGFSGNAKPRTDAARARRGTLGRLGGTVSATGADGTVYALVVPPGALTADTAITLTPLRAIGGLPVTGPVVGVQFGPDGLVLRKPATLRITRKGAAPRTTVGYVYVGNGRDVALERARRAGSALTIEISHFSGAGAGQITVAGFLTYVARLLTGQLTLADVDQFLHELGVVQAIFGEFCLTDATCAELVRRSADLLEREAKKITCGSRAVGENLTLIRDGLHIERNLRLVGKDAEPNRIARERACITNSLVTAAVRAGRGRRPRVVVADRHPREGRPRAGRLRRRQGGLQRRVGGLPRRHRGGPGLRRPPVPRPGRAGDRARNGAGERQGAVRPDSRGRPRAAAERAEAGRRDGDPRHRLRRRSRRVHPEGLRDPGGRIDRGRADEGLQRPFQRGRHDLRLDGQRRHGRRRGTVHRADEARHGDRHRDRPAHRQGNRDGDRDVPGRPGRVHGRVPHDLRQRDARKRHARAERVAAVHGDRRQRDGSDGDVDGERRQHRRRRPLLRRRPRPGATRSPRARWPTRPRPGRRR